MGTGAIGESQAHTMKRRRSALETFDGCPYRYDVLYNTCQSCGRRRELHDGSRCQEFVPIEDKGDESQRGIGFHEAAFRYIDRLARAGLDFDAEEADLAFREGVALTQLAPHLLPDVRNLWDRHTSTFRLHRGAYLSAEERQETERFTWIPDLVYIFPNRVTIKDWKTYYKGLTPEQARKEFQLKFYLVQAMDIWPGFDEYEFVFVFVRLGFEVSVVLTPAEVEQFRPEVEAITLSMDEAARTNNYPAIQGSHCGLCRLKCPLADNPLKLPVRFVSQDQAEQAFGRVLMLEQEVKALKKALAAWCNAEGPLVYNGQEYAHRPNQSKEYPAAELIDFLRDRRVDVDGLLLSRAALGEIAHPKKGHPAVLAWLLEHERATTTWSFKHRKAGEAVPRGLFDVLARKDEDDEN